MPKIVNFDKATTQELKERQKEIPGLVKAMEKEIKDYEKTREEMRLTHASDKWEKSAQEAQIDQDIADLKTESDAIVAELKSRSLNELKKETNVFLYAIDLGKDEFKQSGGKKLPKFSNLEPARSYIDGLSYDNQEIAKKMIAERIKDQPAAFKKEVWKVMKYDPEYMVNNY